MKRRLGKRRREVREELRRRRAALPRRRRRWWLLGIALLLLLLLLRDCSCNEPEVAPLVVESEPAEPVQEIEPVVQDAPIVHSGRIARRNRPAYESKVLDPLPWLASFRLQVSARSVRLAECFVGAPRPGTLKWTASVEPAQGRVSDQTIEPTLQSDELTRQQRACVFGVLSEPVYQLESDGERSTPARVGMVIEF